MLLAYFASQNRSLLAADCLIETVVEMYRRGVQLDSLQFTLSMATLQSGSTLLSEQELDILTARCGIIMLTLQEIGCAWYSQVLHLFCFSEFGNRQLLRAKAGQCVDGQVTGVLHLAGIIVHDYACACPHASNKVLETQRYMRALARVLLVPNYCHHEL